jgi:hypothetical protein
VIEALTTDTPDQPLDVRILPRTPGSNQYFFNAHVPHPLPKGGGIDVVPITQQIAWCFVSWEGVNDLLGGPRGGGVLGDVDMHHAAAFMG